MNTAPKSFPELVSEFGAELAKMDALLNRIEQVEPFEQIERRVAALEEAYERYPAGSYNSNLYADMEE